MSLRALLPALLAALALPAAAWDENCRAEAKRHADADATGVGLIEIVGAAGDLEVFGNASATTVRATGEACARDSDDLARIDLRAERDGNTLRVVAEIPPGIDNAWLDFHVDVPAGVPIKLVDSSGDIDVRDVAALDLRDSSGDVEIDKVPGNVQLEDSSGDLLVSDAGDVHVVSDSSGDIHVTHAKSVRIDVDSSGDIVVRDVNGDVSIGDDSSGGIDVREVGGDFSVDHDGSGDIDYTGVRGQVRIPAEKRADEWDEH